MISRAQHSICTTSYIAFSCLVTRLYNQPYAMSHSLYLISNIRELLYNFTSLYSSTTMTQHPWHNIYYHKSYNTKVHWLMSINSSLCRHPYPLRISKVYYTLQRVSELTTTETLTTQTVITSTAAWGQHQGSKPDKHTGVVIVIYWLICIIWKIISKIWEQFFSAIVNCLSLMFTFVWLYSLHDSQWQIISSTSSLIP